MTYCDKLQYALCDFVTFQIATFGSILPDQCARETTNWIKLANDSEYFINIIEQLLQRRFKRAVVDNKAVNVKVCKNTF